MQFAVGLQHTVHALFPSSNPTKLLCLPSNLVDVTQAIWSEMLKKQNGLLTVNIMKTKINNS